MIKIRLNGGMHEIPGAVSVRGLLAGLGFDGKPVVVELNEEPVFPRDYDEVMVGEGDRVEVVALAAGG
jgi:thiamine biosynthesis protein ThiS